MSSETRVAGEAEHSLIEWIEQSAEDARRFDRPGRAAVYEEVLEKVKHHIEEAARPRPTTVTTGTETVSWQEKIWTVPAETRLSREQFLEAVGRSRTWLYRDGRLSSIPHRKNSSGELVFVAGEIRDWIQAQETVIDPGRIARDNFATEEKGNHTWQSARQDSEDLSDGEDRNGKSSTPSKAISTTTRAPATTRRRKRGRSPR